MSTIPPSSLESYAEQAQQESARLLAALGEITAGGIVAAIQHIGSTSVPGLPAPPCIDLALAATPYPIEGERLAALGYVLAGEQATPFEQRALHSSGRFQLFVSEQGSDEWENHLLLRDYLRADEDAQWRYAAAKATGSATTDKAALFTQLLAEANRWWPAHVGFGPVDFVAQELAGFPHPWTISSGWALDLHLGRVSRVHHDVDVVIARDHQLSLHEALREAGWRFVTPLHGKLEAWPPHMRLEMPRHQAHAHRDGQFIDFLFTDITEEIWHYRRNPTIIRRLDKAILQTSQGIRYLAPELVLLFKSKNTSADKRARSKDQADYEMIRPHLSAEARAWLRWALIASDPGHSWIEELL